MLKKQRFLAIANNINVIIRVTSILNTIIFAVLTSKYYVSFMPAWLTITLPIVSVVIDVFKECFYIWILANKNIYSNAWTNMENSAYNNSRIANGKEPISFKEIVISCFVFHTITLVASIFTLVSQTTGMLNPLDHISLWPTISLVSNILEIVSNIRMRKVLKKLKKEHIE